MERMTIIISCSICTMAIGNKCIIVCPPTTEAMFPFQEIPPCLLTAGNKSLLEIVLDRVSLNQFDEIILIASNHAKIQKLVELYQVKFCEWREDLPRLLYEELLDCENMMVVHGNSWIDIEDISKLYAVMKNGSCGLLTRNYERHEKTGDGFGVWVDQNVKAIYAHPREHYVNAQLCNAYVWNKEMLSFLKYCEQGFHNVNCGQMPDQAFYIEEAIQNAIEYGVCFESVSCQKPYVYMRFPWDIAYANILYCQELNEMTENHLYLGTKIDGSVKCHGYLETGIDVVIQDGVIFEGNCRIGNHVRIEKGAIIGKNCVIGDGSIVGYQCRIHDYTVIGTNNKIGYHAEVCGVTFDGVCAVHGCEIYGIIGKKVDIAAGVVMAILRFDDEHVIQKINGRKYSGLYTNYICLGNYCRTGVGNIFLPGVKVGARSAIGPGVLVENDIKENSLVLLKQETVVKEWGSNRYGW